MVEVTERETKSVTRKRRQFGLKHLLFLMLLAAAGIVAWQKLIYVHPAHRNALYEKATYSRSGYINFEHCRIAMDSIVRSDRNGAVVAEDGFGVGQAVQPANKQALTTSGPWLDTAQVELSGSGGTFEVLEARVFDFESRQIIDQLVPQTGVRMSGPTTLQICRVGEKLPDRVDVFLRVMVYGEDNTPTILQPHVGAKCNLPGGTLQISELHRGMQSYTSETGVVSDPTEANSVVALMLTFEGTWPPKNRYKIVAVKKDGSRVHRHRFMRFPGSYETGTRPNAADLVTLSAGLDDIAHLELRPLDGEHVFFFEGVRLPSTSNAKFKTPPVADVKIGGDETTVRVPEFEPLDVSLTTIKGDAVGGVSARYRTRGAIRQKANGPEHVDSKTTIVETLDGLSKPNFLLIVNPGPNQRTSNQRGSLSGGGRYLAASVVPLPIDEVESIRLQLP